MGCARGQAGVRTVDEDVLAVVHGEAPRGARADVWVVVQGAVDKRRRRRRVRLEVRLPGTTLEIVRAGRRRHPPSLRTVSVWMRPM